MTEILKQPRKRVWAMAAALSAAIVLLLWVIDKQAAKARALLVVTPVLAPIVVFPDFASLDNVQVKKQMFFDFMQAFLDAENRSILAQRASLSLLSQKLASEQPLNLSENEQLQSLAVSYRLDKQFIASATQLELIEQLQSRVDVIPSSLALAQAANESAWGTSRFTLEGNSIFGQWCYTDNCGIVPRRRASGATHQIEKFETIDASVSSYFRNMNTHGNYQYFRELRNNMRVMDMDLDSLVLAFGLGGYSERGHDYVDEVQKLVRQNDLRSRDKNSHKLSL